MAGRPLYATVGSVPAYKHRPQMAGDTPVWRYLTLSAVIATIKTRQLRLTRVDRFQDPFEGSVPKTQIDEQDLLFISAEFPANDDELRRRPLPGHGKFNAARRGPMEPKVLQCPGERLSEFAKSGTDPRLDGSEGFVTLAGFTCFYGLPGDSPAKQFQCLSPPRHDRKRPLLAQCDNAA